MRLPFALLRQALRSLMRAPGYALTTMLTLAIGMAASLAALAPAWDLLGQPFAFREPGQVVCLSGEGPMGAPFPRPLSSGDFWALQKELQGIQGLAACRDSGGPAETVEGIREVRTALVSPGFCQLMGLSLQVGRDFTYEECCLGEAGPLILTHQFWLLNFGGDPEVLGRTFNIDGVPHTIVGILAAQKHLPGFLADVVAFQPLRFRGGEVGHGMPSCWVYGRLRQGTGLAQLQSELDRLAPNLGPARPKGDPSWGIKAYGLLARWRRELAPSLALTTLSGLLVLLMACANVTHLMLARNLGRTREWGLRVALGAGPGGIGWPTLAEAFTLSCLGLVLALLGLRILEILQVVPLALPLERLLLPLAATLVATLVLTTLLPIRWAARLDLNEALKEGGTASGSRSSTMLRNSLVMVQLAFAFVLLVAAGMSLRALEKLQGIEPGFNLKNLYMASVVMTSHASSDGLAGSRALQRHLQNHLEQEPGIQAVALSDTIPLVDQGHNGDVWPDGDSGALEAGEHDIGPAYFHTLQIPFLAGRDLRPEESGACVVSQQFARRAWGDANPLGHQVHLGGADHPALTVVGVVGEARMSRLLVTALPAVYTPLALQDAAWLTIYIRSAASPQAIQNLVRRAVDSAPGTARLRVFKPLQTLAMRELEGPRILRWQTLAAGLLATFLAVVGLAGTMAQAATSQRREWGIRMALGASPTRLLAQVSLQVMRLLAAGLGLGLALLWPVGAILGSQFQGVDSATPWQVLVTVLVLASVCLAGGIGPALGAVRTEAGEALRQE